MKIMVEGKRNKLITDNTFNCFSLQAPRALSTHPDWRKRSEWRKHRPHTAAASWGTWQPTKTAGEFRVAEWK